jgi:NTE family protein
MKIWRTGWMVGLVFLFALSIGAQAKIKKETASRRPKIGLALGGGGALGLSHVGVLRALEEMQIPIDYIAGASMGAIVGGLYSSGVSTRQMEVTMSELDWWDVMNDNTAREDMQFRRKRDDGRYLMDLEMGLKGMSLIFPYGLSSGQKLNNVIQTWTVNAAGAPDFDQLNIPFRATATDIRSGELVLLKDGNLATALRASMAVPGAFTPVLIDDHLLVDGGIVNNLPVDVVREMGADVVIAVDVTKMDAVGTAESDFDSLGAILGRTYDIMKRPDQDRQGRDADILITPDTRGFSASDFQKAAEIIPVGDPAVEAVADQLRALSVDEETYRAFTERQQEQHHQRADLNRIEVVNNERVTTRVIRAQLRSQVDEPVDLEQIEGDVARIYGMGNFQSVSYQLKPEDEGLLLEVSAQEKYWGPGYVHLGMRLESDMDHSANWSVLLNYSRRCLNRLGGEIDLDLEGGSNQGIALEWFQPLNYSSTLFIAPSLWYRSENINFFSNETQVARYERSEQALAVDVGSQLFDWGEIRAGIVYGSLEGRRKTGSDELVNNVDETVAGWRGSASVDRLDDAFFYTKGFRLNVTGWVADESLGADQSYEQLEGSALFVKSIGKHTFSLAGSMGHSLDSEVPVYDQFTLGGFGTLPGMTPDQLRGPYYTLAALEYRFQLGRLSPSLGHGIYWIVKAAGGNVFQTEEDMELDDQIGSLATGLGIDTIFGPVVLAAGIAEREQVSYYFSVGNYF